MRHHVAPVFAAGARKRRLHDLVVFRAAFVGEDVEAVRMRLNLIFVVGLARRNESALSGRAQIEQPRLAGLMVPGGDDEEAAILASGDAGEEAGIGLLVYQLILRRIAAHAMPHDLQRAAVLVDARVIECRAIGVPDRRAFHVGHLIGEILAGLKIAQLDLEELRALIVERVSQEPVIVAPDRRAQREEWLARGHGVAVEQHRGLPAFARLPRPMRGCWPPVT